MTDALTLFHRERLNTDLFQLENVMGDNACFYRSIANGIRFFHDQDPNKSYNDLQEQTQLAKEIQQIVIHWVENNPDSQICYHEDMTVSVKDLIEMIHDLSYHQYLYLYSHFAGSLESLPHRWGSFFEQSIISEIFKIPIIVMTLEKFDTHLDKIISGRIWLGITPYQNTKYKIIQVSGKQYIENTEKDPIFILWRRNKQGQEHYMALYPKQSIKQKIINLLSYS